MDQLSATEHHHESSEENLHLFTLHHHLHEEISAMASHSPSAEEQKPLADQLVNIMAQIRINNAPSLPISMVNHSITVVAQGLRQLYPLLKGTPREIFDQAVSLKMSEVASGIRVAIEKRI